MDVIKVLIESGGFSLIDMILLAVIGILIYFMTIKQRDNESNVSSAIDGMQALIQEERHQTEALSRTVYTIRQEMEKEREKNFALREEILILKQENIRLQNLVTQMETLVKQYQDELFELKNSKGGEE